MGYDLHITRADDWSDSHANPISAEEWLAVVAADPELKLDPANGPHFAVWTQGADPEGAWFDWSDGQVFTKNPDRATLATMLRLAERLGAKVQGDDGELYTDPSQLDDTVQIANGVTPEVRSYLRWKRFMSIAGPIIMLLCVALIAWKVVRRVRGQ